MIEIVTSQRKYILIYILYLIISFIFINISVPINGFAKTETPYTATFQTKHGEHIITLEVARTEKQKMRGLMFRKTLAKNSGMIFLYNKAVRAGIWMKNTKIPLDIIFIDCHNKIVHVVTRQPNTTNVSYAPTKICKIIEVNAGLMKKIGLREYSKVTFESYIK